MLNRNLSMKAMNYLSTSMQLNIKTLPFRQTLSFHFHSYNNRNGIKHIMVPIFMNNIRFMSKERAGKAVKPGAALVVDGAPHKVLKITQGKRGKGGGYVR